jgi:exopolysaccharide production protein ExoZ
VNHPPVGGKREEALLLANVPLIQSDRKLDGLHGVRGIAALSVALFHVQSIPSLAMTSWQATLIGPLYLSVHLFFVLSAFSLYHSSLYAPASYGAYLVKRFFRIAPLYYAMIAFVVWRKGFPGWGELVSNLTFTFNLIPGLEASMVWAGWSVGVEMLFYLLLPALLAFIDGWVAYSFLFLVAAVVSAVVWHVTAGAPGLREYYAYYSVAGNLPSLFAGLLAYSLFKVLDRRRRQAWANATFASLFGILLATALLDPLGLQWRAPGFYFAFWGLPFGGLCLWQALYPSRFTKSRPMQWIADRSFSIYLLHAVVIEAVRRAYEYLQYRGMPGGGWLYAACLVSGLLLLLAVVQLSYRLVELPGIATGRRIAARLNKSAKGPRSVIVALEPKR